MIIEVRIGTQKYKLHCRPDETDKILEYADRLDSRVREIADQMADSPEQISPEKLLVIAGLTLEEEIQNKIDIISGESKQQFYNEDELYEMLSEHTLNLVDYIKKITNKIDNL